MIAKNNEILTSASKTLYEYNSDWLVLERCRAREDYENHERNMQLLLDDAICKKEQAVAEKDNAIKHGINSLVSSLRKANQSNEFILGELMENFGLTKEEAMKYL